MRATFILLFVIIIVTEIAYWFVCPGEVAIHFGPDGQPDTWGPAWVNFTVLAGVNLLLFLVFFFLPVLAKVIPAKYINIPNKDYWLREENRACYLQRLSRNFSIIGILTMLMILAATIFAMQANLAKPPKFNEVPFLLFVVLYVVCTLLWTIKFFLGFQKPKQPFDELLQK